MCCAGRTSVTIENVLCVVQVVQVLRLRTGCVLCRLYRYYDREPFVLLVARCYDRGRVVYCAGHTGVTTEDMLCVV